MRGLWTGVFTVGLLAASAGAQAQLEFTGDGEEQGPLPAVAELEAFIDGAMEAQMKREHLAGAVVAVVQNGALYFSKGYGYADLETRTPVDPASTLFRIGTVAALSQDPERIVYGVPTEIIASLTIGVLGPCYARRSSCLR